MKDTKCKAADYDRLRKEHPNLSDDALDFAVKLSDLPLDDLINVEKLLDSIIESRNKTAES